MPGFNSALDPAGGSFKEVMEMKRFMITAVMLGMVFGISGLSLADMAGDTQETARKIHQVRSLMDHSMGMVTEGSGLIMVARTKLAPPIDRFTEEKGMKLIESGKDMVLKTLGTDEMMSMSEAGMKDDPMMVGIKDLGKSILKYIDIVEKLDMSGSVQDRIKMHNTHVMINHAMGMAAEGANLVLLGSMKLAGSLDKYTIDNGRMMLKDARATLTDVTGSETMMEMDKAGMGDDPMMTQTKDLLKTAIEIVDELEKMSM
jgi:hypothetical protein